MRCERNVLTFALNHMTVPSLTMKNLGDLARSLGMSGIELRNDLAQRLFDGQTPVAGMTDGMTVIALAEVKAFDGPLEDGVLIQHVLHQEGHIQPMAVQRGVVSTAY